MKYIISNAFALSMLPAGSWYVRCNVLGVEYARAIAQHEFVSAVGHADTARLFTSILGVNVSQNRVSVKLDRDTVLLVGQYVGPRLPEGSSVLPDGAAVSWYEVCIGGWSDLGATL